MSLSARKIRERIHRERKKLSSSVAKRKSKQVLEKFFHELKLSEYSLYGKKIALFRSLPWEINLTGLERYLNRLGAKVYFPRVTHPGSGKMEMVEWKPAVQLSFWTTGPYGIEQPRANLRAASPSLFDLILVPGVAFGTHGERIGMGAGYYDRILAKTKKALKISFAFDFQVLPELPQEPWDQKIDWIISPSYEIKGPRVFKKLFRRLD